MLPKYKRILLKLSGEALMGSGSSKSSDPFDPKIIEQYDNDIKTVTDLGVQVALVIGGGNIYRGLNESESGIERAHGDPKFRRSHPLLSRSRCRADRACLRRPSRTYRPAYCGHDARIGCRSFGERSSHLARRTRVGGARGAWTGN